MSAQHILPSGPDPGTIQLMEVPQVWLPGDPATDAEPGGYPSSGQGIAPRTVPATDDQGWPRQFAVVLAEVLAGIRPARQIQPWLSSRGSLHLKQVLPLFAGGHPPRVRRVMTARQCPDVIEMTMIVTVGPRTRALAIRLESVRPTPGNSAWDKPGSRHARAQPPPSARRDGSPSPVRWVCTDIEAA